MSSTVVEGAGTTATPSNWTNPTAPPRRRRNRARGGERSTSDAGRPNNRAQREQRDGQRGDNTSATGPGADTAGNGGNSNTNRPGRRRGGGHGANQSHQPQQAQQQPQQPHGTSQGSQLPQTSSRRRQFRSGLTTADNTSQPSAAPVPDPQAPIPASTDLTTRLIAEFRTPPYPDCPICFASLLPPQPTWSCVPTLETATCCFSTFHLKCIKAWSTKSVQETRDAYRARNEDKLGEWRCPGCQTKREAVPSSYQCFCGSVSDPKPGRLGTPHSCGNSCGRKRLACDHPCPLNCHPGPCPPCTTIIEEHCYCRRTTHTFRCSHLRSAPSLSCRETCDKSLGCGTHRCTRECHPGSCGPCDKVEQVTCYCGREQKGVPCGQGVPKLCSDATKTWEGRFACESACLKPYACQIHKCQEPCHPHDLTPSPCPFDPSVVHTCPCGKRPIEVLAAARTKCEDPIPTCGSTCAKPLTGCSHVCSSPCHVGLCPPCAIPISQPCRCGSIVQHISCAALQQQESVGEEILCRKTCQAMRNCGRHVCKRVCCPLAGVSNAKGKGKKKLANSFADFELEESPWHVCDEVCDKILTCGLHRCTEQDHRGRCPPCLQSSYEELVCRCSRTVIMPPVACGTRMACTYPCNRPPPTCGHPKTPHSCHEEGDCPPCPFLTSKLCACGKMEISNVRCSQEKVSCGRPCGKGLSCGFHACDKLCHGDECPPCTSVCNKDRKLCLPYHHGCQLACHAPIACPESEPCSSIITLSCGCGRVTQPAKCGRSTTNPTGREAQSLKCTQECAIAARNARLADALGIVPGAGAAAKGVVYGDGLLGFARANYQFCVMVEKNFEEFLKTDRRTHLLPHMSEVKRKFVVELAKVYRMDTAAVDVEPQRSIELIRRIDSRVPIPLLSSSAPSASMPSLGKLGDMRTKPTTPMPAAVASPQPVRKGWASVLTQQPTRAASASSSPAPGVSPWGQQPKPASTTPVQTKPRTPAPPKPETPSQLNPIGPTSIANTRMPTPGPSVSGPSTQTTTLPRSSSPVPSDWEDDKL